MSISNDPGRPYALQAGFDQVIHLCRRKADAGIRRAVVDLQLVVRLRKVAGLGSLVTAAIYGLAMPKAGWSSWAGLFVRLVWPVPSEFIT